MSQLLKHFMKHTSPFSTVNNLSSSPRLSSPRYKSEIAKLKAQLAEKEATLKQLRTELQLLREDQSQRVDDLKVALEVIQNYKDENSMLRKEVEKLHKKAKMGSSSSPENDKELKNLRKNLQNVKDELKKLRKENEELRASFAEEQNLLQKVEELRNIRKRKFSQQNKEKRLGKRSKGSS